MLDTRTRPEPDKTVDDLWFDARVYDQYGSLLERMKYGQPLSTEPQSVDDGNALDYFLYQIPARARLDQFMPPAWFRRNSLGQGSSENYWDTQRSFLHRNEKAKTALKKRIEELKRAREAGVISRKRSA